MHMYAGKQEICVNGILRLLDRAKAIPLLLSACASARAGARTSFPGRRPVPGCGGLFVVLFLFGAILPARAQTVLPVPPGMPNPLAFQNGHALRSAQQWPRRRAELIRLFTEQVYGRMPPRPAEMRFRVVDTDQHALRGLATRHQVIIDLDGQNSGPHIDLLLYIPNAVRRPPVILGMNFWGNETVNTDPGIRISDRWVESGGNPFLDLSCVHDHRATTACRGIDAQRWPVDEILRHGYALATFYRGDLDPDHPDDFADSIRRFYPQLQQGGDNFSAVGGWAWGLSRALDYLATDRGVDGHRVVAFGWSRLGKAALWAAATDTRFAGAISNESGAGGAKLFHHLSGETIEHLNTAFPWWFCRNFHRDNGQEATLPFDQNLVLALIAPRPLYVASAIDDANADPQGEFLAAQSAAAVYRFLGYANVALPEWPAVNQPILGRVSYHVRSGSHNVTPFDWEQYLAFCDRFLARHGPEVASTVPAGSEWRSGERK